MANSDNRMTPSEAKAILGNAAERSGKWATLHLDNWLVEPVRTESELHAGIVLAGAMAINQKPSKMQHGIRRLCKLDRVCRDIVRDIAVTVAGAGKPVPA